MKTKRWVRMTICLAIALLVSCQRGDPAPVAKRKELSRLASLPGLRSSSDPKLQDEYARLMVERATPDCLAQDESAADPDLAVEIPRLIPATIAGSLSARIAELLQGQPTMRSDPGASPAWGPGEIQNVLRVLDRLKIQREKFRELILRPNATFRLRHEEGWLADVSFITATQAVQDSWILELQWLATTNGSTDDALRALEPLNRSIGLLAAKRHLACRLAAASQRLKMLRAVESLVRSEMAGPDCLQAIQRMLADSLEHWPGDSEAWIGERACGLHTYELVRAGNAMDVLLSSDGFSNVPPEELVAIGEALHRDVDVEEAFYLSTMRKVIAGCASRYWERREWLASIRDELDEWPPEETFPVFAQRTLLRGLERGQRLQAIDWLAVAAWNLAIREALGDRSSAPVINPLTGQPLRVVRREAVIEIEGLDCREVATPRLAAFRRP